MRFQPVIRILEVPRDSSYILFKDITPVNSTDGYGSNGNPSSWTDIVSINMFLQYFGETAIQFYQNDLQGTLEKEAKLPVTLKDGVYKFQVLYGVFDPTSVLISGTNVTVHDSSIYFVNQYISFSSDTDTLYQITAINGNVLTLNTAPTVSLDYVVRYYTAEKHILVTNCGEGNIIKEISQMAQQSTNCDPMAAQGIFDDILLKLATEIAFQCGQFAKAHNGAILLCSKQSSIQGPCKDCH